MACCIVLNGPRKSLCLIGCILRLIRTLVFVLDSNASRWMGLGGCLRMKVVGSILELNGSHH